MMLPGERKIRIDSGEFILISVRDVDRMVCRRPPGHVIQLHVLINRCQYFRICAQAFCHPAEDIVHRAHKAAVQPVRDGVSGKYRGCPVIHGSPPAILRGDIVAPDFIVFLRKPRIEDHRAVMQHEAAALTDKRKESVFRLFTDPLIGIRRHFLSVIVEYDQVIAFQCFFRRTAELLGDMNMKAAG